MVWSPDEMDDEIQNFKLSRSLREAAKWMRKGKRSASVDKASAAVQDQGAAAESCIGVVVVSSVVETTSVGTCGGGCEAESRTNWERTF